MIYICMPFTPYSDSAGMCEATATNCPRRWQYATNYSLQRTNHSSHSHASFFLDRLDAEDSPNFIQTKRPDATSEADTHHHLGHDSSYGTRQLGGSTAAACDCLPWTEFTFRIYCIATDLRLSAGEAELTCAATGRAAPERIERRGEGSHKLPMNHAV